MIIDRGLATKVSEKVIEGTNSTDPNVKPKTSITIKLNFEPSGRGITSFDGQKEDDEFYVEYRQNICVVCGKDKNYLRYQIIPSMYRMFFPNKYKSHRSHDVLLICFDCNETEIQKQAQLKDKL